MIKKFHLLGLIAVLALLIFLPSKSKAETSGIQISPLTFNFEVNPGYSAEGKVTVTNRKAAAFDYTIETEIFEKISDDGAPTFQAVLPKEGVQTFLDWINFPDGKDGRLEPGKSVDVKFKISIPQNAEPRGYYGAIFAKEIVKAPDQKTVLGVASRVGTLVLAAVSGDVSKTAEIIEFKVPKIVWKGPVGLTMKVKNTGTIHYDSKGLVQLKSLFGSTSEIDFGTHTIIPGSARSYETTWNKKYPFGRYQVTASATDGDGQPQAMTVILWAIPLIIVIPVLVGIIILIIVIRYLRKHFKYVSSKSNQNNNQPTDNQKNL